jgi:hypothetical protein
MDLIDEVTACPIPFVAPRDALLGALLTTSIWAAPVVMIRIYLAHQK